MISHAQHVSKSIKPLFSVLALALLVIQVLAILCALAKPAYAYVDPGSGLLAFQMFSTTFAGVIFMVRKRLRTFLKTAFLTKSSDAKKPAIH